MSQRHDEVYKTVNDVILAHARGEVVPHEVLERFADSWSRFSVRALYQYDNVDELKAAYRDLDETMRELAAVHKAPPPKYHGRKASLGCPECGGPSAIRGEKCDGCR